jgi:hypothetical protein
MWDLLGNLDKTLAPDVEVSDQRFSEKEYGGCKSINHTLSSKPPILGPYAKTRFHWSENVKGSFKTG